MKQFRDYLNENTNITIGSLITSISANPIQSRMYHGSENIFSKFKPGDPVNRTDRLFFSADYKTAKSFGKYVHVTDIKVNRPVIINGQGSNWERIYNQIGGNAFHKDNGRLLSTDAIIHKLKQQSIKVDSIIFMNIQEVGFKTNVLVSFFPDKQCKIVEVINVNKLPILKQKKMPTYNFKANR